MGCRLKRTPLIRKTPLQDRRGFAAMSAIREAAKAVKDRTEKAVAIRTGLKRGRSTGKPTKAQRERWDAMRARGCVACHLNGVDHGLARASYGRDLEIHHLLSGGRRIGHHATVCLCHFHHQGKRLPYPDHGYEEQARKFGPSLGREPRRFREVYGADDGLLAYQDHMLELLDAQFGVDAQ